MRKPPKYFGSSCPVTRSLAKARGRANFLKYVGLMNMHEEHEGDPRRGVARIMEFRKRERILQDVFWQAAEEDEHQVTSSDVGGLRGLARDVKPAFLLPTGMNGDALSTRLRESQAPDSIRRMGNLLVNVPVLEARLADERVLAKELGWDFEKSVEENVEHLHGSVIRPNPTSCLTGFVLGFPESAIRDWTHDRELYANGIPRPDDFFNKKREVTIDATDWEVGDQKLMEEMHDLGEKMWEKLEQLAVAGKRAEAKVVLQQFKRQFLLRYQDDIKRLYREYYGQSNEDINFLFNLRNVQILEPDNYSVFGFLASYPEGEEPEDIRNLRLRVKRAFQDDKVS